MPRFEKLSEEQKRNIITSYQNKTKSVIDLCEEYGVSDVYVYKLFKKNGVAVLKNAKKWSFNENYFDIIDSDRKAYWLGWLYSDGYNNQKLKRVTLGLQACDIDVLNKLNEDLESNRPISFHNRSALYTNQQDQLTAIFQGEHFSNTLADLGVVQTKSAIVKFPTEEQISRKYIRYFLRGFYEGNGSCGIKYVKGAPELNSSLCSTIYFCESVKKYLNKELGTKGCIYQGKENIDKPFRKLYYGGNQQVYKLFAWLYANPDIYLDRKYAKFKQQEKILLEYGTITQEYVDRLAEQWL